MSSSGLSAVSGSSKVDVVIDTGNPFLNKTIDGFLKIGLVAASRVAVEETYLCIQKGSVSKSTAENALKQMCKEGVYWGTIAGVYIGMEYGMERARGTSDWKNAMLGGAIAGALMSVASSNGDKKIVVDAIRGGAVATAVEFLNHLT